MSKIDPNSGLTDQHQRFADEYLVDFNGTAAYARAGYKASGNAAEVGASRLLAKPEIQAYLRKRKEALAAKLEVTQEDVLRRLVMFSFADRRQLFDERGCLKPMHELTEEQAALVAGLEVREEFVQVGKEKVFDGYTRKAKFVDPLRSTQLLGQHYGLFKQVLEHTGKNGEAIGVVVVPEKREPLQADAPQAPADPPPPAAAEPAAPAVATAAETLPQPAAKLPADLAFVIKKIGKKKA